MKSKMIKEDNKAETTMKRILRENKIQGGIDSEYGELYTLEDEEEEEADMPQGFVEVAVQYFTKGLKT